MANCSIVNYRKWKWNIGEIVAEKGHFAHFLWSNKQEWKGIKHWKKSNNFENNYPKFISCLDCQILVQYKLVPKKKIDPQIRLEQEYIRIKEEYIISKAEGSYLIFSLRYQHAGWYGEEI